MFSPSKHYRSGSGRFSNSTDKTDREVFRAVQQLFKENSSLPHYSPSVVEIAERSGYARSCAHRAIGRLVDSGKLGRVAGRHRSLYVPKKTRKSA